MPDCPSCGVRVSEGERSCSACGADVDRHTESFPQLTGEPALDAAAVAAGITEPVLVVAKGPVTGERFVLDRPEVTIGRDPSSDIFLEDLTVSREHAFLVTGEDGSVTIRDRGSLNGTWVNGATVESAVLANGDHVRIGRFLMIYFSGGGA